MQIKCLGCGNETEVIYREIKLQDPLGYQRSESAIIEIKPACGFPILSRGEVIKLRDFLSDVIAQSYSKHYEV